MTLIRRATPADAAAIAHVHLTSWRAQFIPLMPPELVAHKNLDAVQESALWQKRLTHEPERITVVAEIERVIGFVTGGRERSSTAGYDAELYQIYVLPETQGQGIGRRLVHDFVLALHEIGFKTMLVWVVTINPAVKFYADVLGGVFIAERPIPEVDGRLIEAGYGWNDLPALIARTHP